MRILIAFVEHSYSFEYFFDASLDFGFVFPAGGLKYELEVRIGAAVGQQLEILKHDANLAAQVGNVPAADGVEVIVEDA